MPSDRKVVAIPYGIRGPLPVATKSKPEPADPRVRKVLMICYAFPPTGGPGVQRPAKFAKYLPRFGWHPVVWTTDRADGFPSDPTLVEELPAEVRILAGGSGMGIQSVRRVLHRFSAARVAAHPSGAGSALAAAIDWRLQAWHARPNRVGFPDDCGPWARRSIQPLARLMARERVDLIWSTFSPASSHVLALELKRKTGIPWVADFRDLWTDDCRYRETCARRSAAHRQLEQEILATADAVIGVTPRQTEILAAHFPGETEKYHTITNGFDPDDFREAIDIPSTSESFVLAYIGRFDLTRTHDELFNGLRHFHDSLGASKAAFQLHVVGFANPRARQKLAETGISCHFTDYVSHAEAIQRMRAADALLLTAPDGHNGESVIRAKIFEYLAARRPVLVVGPRGGQCERIVRDCEAGLTVSFSAREFSAALGKIFVAWQAGNPFPGCRADFLNAYSRVELTRQLAEVFDSLVIASPVESGRLERQVAACAP